MKRKDSISIILGLILLGSIGYTAYRQQQPTIQSTNTTTRSSQSSDPADTANQPSFSLTDPKSIWIISNKQNPLPAEYEPTDLVAVGNERLRSEAATAIMQLVAAAKSNNINLSYVSGYRSYSYQQTIYSNYVRQSGQAKADTFSARPGYSDHQTGLAIDVGNSDGSCELAICFGNTAGGSWVTANAYLYGFVVRYPEGTEEITGYQYEPWHLRYVGVWLATKIRDNPQTLEEYFGLPAAPNY